MLRITRIRINPELSEGFRSSRDLYIHRSYSLVSRGGKAEERVKSISHYNNVKIRSGTFYIASDNNKSLQQPSKFFKQSDKDQMLHECENWSQIFMLDYPGISDKTVFIHSYCRGVLMVNLMLSSV